MLELTPTPAVVDPVLAWSCPDCGAPAGDGCTDTCPSATATLAAELAAADHATIQADDDPPCCPTPQAAARTMCGCWGAGAGAWVGSAA